MKPSIGRIVHYVARDSADGVYPPTCRAAVITQVNYDVEDTPAEGYIGVAVLNPTGMFFHESCDYDKDHAPGSWHWVERVE